MIRWFHGKKFDSIRGRESGEIALRGFRFSRMYLQTGATSVRCGGTKTKREKAQVLTASRPCN